MRRYLHQHNCCLCAFTALKHLIALHVWRLVQKGLYEIVTPKRKAETPKKATATKRIKTEPKEDLETAKELVANLVS